MIGTMIVYHIFRLVWPSDYKIFIHIHSTIYLSKLKIKLICQIFPVEHIFIHQLQTKEVKDDLMADNTKLLYVAPETLSKPDTIDFLKHLKIPFIAIDEAHCISEWGHDFRPEYRKLREAINAINKKTPILALTASATPKVQQDIIRNLNMENAKLFISSFNRPNLYYEVRPKPSDPMVLNKEIIRFIKDNPHKSGIIYCLTRKKVEEISELLRINNIKSLPYHAGLDTKTRNENQFERQEPYQQTFR